MKHSQPHTRRDFQRQAATQRRSIDGFSGARANTGYQRRSSGILPGNDAEYMISLGTRASRRNEVVEPKQPWTVAAIKNATNKAKHIDLMNFIRVRTKAFVVLSFVIVGLVGVVSLVKSNAPVIANEDLRQSLETNGDTPHSKSAYNQVGYVTAPDLPRFLTIGKLGVNTRITRLSVRENSEPKYPQNIHDVGWYENSAKPGESGAALLIGHISGADQQGVFHDLTNLVPGDEFQVELGDGTIKNFFIVKMEAYDRGNVDYADLLSSSVSGKPGLNLLTAVGAFESNSDVVQQLGVFAVEKISFLEGTQPTTE